MGDRFGDDLPPMVRRALFVRSCLLWVVIILVLVGAGAVLWLLLS